METRGTVILFPKVSLLVIKYLWQQRDIADQCDLFINETTVETATAEATVTTTTTTTVARAGGFFRRTKIPTKKVDPHEQEQQQRNSSNNNNNKRAVTTLNSVTLYSKIEPQSLKQF